MITIWKSAEREADSFTRVTVALLAVYIVHFLTLFFLSHPVAQETAWPLPLLFPISSMAIHALLLSLLQAQ